MAPPQTGKGGMETKTKAFDDQRIRSEASKSDFCRGLRKEDGWWKQLNMGKRRLQKQLSCLRSP